MQTALVRLTARPVAYLSPYQGHSHSFTYTFSTGSVLYKRRKQSKINEQTASNDRRDDKRQKSTYLHKSECTNFRRAEVKGPLYTKASGRPTPKHVLPGSPWLKELPIDPSRTWRGFRRIYSEDESEIVPTSTQHQSGSTSTSTQHASESIPTPAQITETADVSDVSPPTSEPLRALTTEAEFVPHLLPGEPGYIEPFGDGPARKIPVPGSRPLIRKFMTESPIQPTKPSAGMAVDIGSELDAELPHTRAGTEIGIWKAERGFESTFRMQGYNHRSNEEPDEVIELLALLQSTARTLGKEGIALTWHQLRGTKLTRIPTVGPAAVNIWRILLMNPQLHEEIFEYAVEIHNATGDVYEPLYEHVLGHRLATSSQDTFAWHQRFKRVYKIPRNALRRLVNRAATSKQSLEVFMGMYSDNYRDSDPIYDAIITCLVGRHMYREAIAWHNKLFTCGDFPSSAVSATGLMDRFQRFRNQVVARSLLEHTPVQKVTELGSGGKLRRVDGSFKFNRETVYSLLGEKHGIAPKTFTDEFCARLFATKAFSTDLVISSLKMFGIQAIGPLALREMAIKRADPKNVKRKIEQLTAAGISTGKSVFSRAVMKLSEDGRSDLLRSLLDSDQHPDVLEDTPLQRKLLASYLSQNDWLSVHRTLMILTLFHEDPAQESWNILLRHYLESRSPRSHQEAASEARNVRTKVQQVVFDMSMAKVQVTAESVQSILRKLLAPRRSGRRPITRPKANSDLDDLNLVTHIFFRITSTGQILPATYWRELIRRYGMLDRFESVARLCLQLTKLYSPSSQLQLFLSDRVPAMLIRKDPILTNHDIDPRPASTLEPSHPAHPFRQLFNSAAVRALVSWGFQSGTQLLQGHPARRRYQDSLQTRVPDALWPSHIQPPSIGQAFLRGISLVDKMRSEGVFVDTGVVEKVVRQRLWQLFSPTLSWRMTNRRSQLLNPYSLEECLQGVLDVWKGPTLFPGLLLPNSEDYYPEGDVSSKPARSGAPASSAAHYDFSSHEFDFDALVSEETNAEIQMERQPKPHPDACNQTPELPRTILSELCSNSHLTLAKQVQYRRTIARILFGSNPRMGHRRRTDAKRVDADDWDEVVTEWASRGGRGRFRMRVGGLAKTKRDEIVIVRKKMVLKVGMVRRRNIDIVSGRGSRAVGYVKADQETEWHE